VIANVARTIDEAEIQKETGRAVGRMVDEEEVVAAPAIEEMVEEDVLDQVAEDVAEASAESEVDEVDSEAADDENTSA
jgi:hypothetical protein